jgi:hypothetical protein
MDLLGLRAAARHASVARRRRGAGAALACLFIAAVMSSCFGDVLIERATGTDAGPTTGIETIQPLDPCIPGEMRCRENWVDRCFPSGTELPPRWTPVEDCQSAALCASPGTCTPPVCKPREVRCEGPVPQRCRADLTGWEDLGECVSAAHCSLDADKCGTERAEAPCCLAAPCDPGELRCNARDVQRCRPDQTDLDLVESCATPALCTQSLVACAAAPMTCACTPPVCEAGSTRCTGSTLERCNVDQTGFEFVQTCDNATLCELGRVRSPLSCEPAACAPGAFACSPEGVLQSCNATQTSFDVVQPCPGGAAFCNAGQGRCTETPCEPGDRACDGAAVQTCREDQTGFIATGELCETAQLCLADGAGAAICLPPACGVSDVRCAGSQLQRCNAGRTDFGNAGPACPRDDLCSALRQRCDFCVPSRRECTPDVTSSRTCAADGNSFGPSTFCPLGCISSTGACQTCNVGSYTCQNGLLSRCNDGFSFTPLNRGADCSGASVVTCSGNVPLTTPCGGLGCNVARSSCNECSGQGRVCDGAAAFRSCQPDGTLGPTTGCQAGLVCTGGGQCVCTPNVASCDGGELLVCDATGGAIVPGARCSGAGGNVLRTCSLGQVTTNTCGSAALCLAASGADCPACLEGESTCSEQSDQPLACIGGELIAQGPCLPGLSCEGPGECRCAAGGLRCDGDALLACDLARTGFEPALACDGATLRVCTDGEVVETECQDEAACLGAVAGVCGPPADE